MRKPSSGEVQTLLQANFGAIKWQTKLQTQSLSQHHNESFPLSLSLWASQQFSLGRLPLLSFDIQGKLEAAS